MKLIAGILDLFFPPRQVCPLCGTTEAQKQICAGCLGKISEYRLEPVCSRCGRYFQQQSGPGFSDSWGETVLCLDCFHQERYFRLARSAGPYEGDLKSAVQRLKYTGRRDLAGHLADLMFQSIASNPYYIMAQLITAVPLSRERLRQRGFNQSELLAFELAGKMKVDLMPLLRKVRETPAQTSLDRAGRGKNLVGAFEIINPGAVRGKAVLLVDDVTTPDVRNTKIMPILKALQPRVPTRAAPGRRTLFLLFHHQYGLY